MGPLLSLFGVMWVIPSSVWDTLLSWKGLHVGKKRRKVFFGQFERQGTGYFFHEKPFSMQRTKTSFLFLLWSETKITIIDGPLSIAGLLIGWVVNKWGLPFLRRRNFFPLLCIQPF